MALAGRGFSDWFFAPPTHALTITAGLLAAALLALLAGPVAACRLPARPPPCRLSACRAAIAGQGVNRREPSFTPLEQADSRSARGRLLPIMRPGIMLSRAHGSCYSRKVKSRSESSAPLRDALLNCRVVRTSRRQSLITPLARLHQRLPASVEWPPFRRDSAARALAPWPRETGPQLSRY